MSDSKSLVRLVPEPEKPPHRVTLDPSQAIPHQQTELVTEEEQRHTEQVKHKAALPSDLFRRRTTVGQPLVQGATVNTETLLGFLAAMESILPTETNYPILSSTKIWYDPDTARLYLEAGSHAVWTVVAVKVLSGPPTGFTAIMPIKRARNVLTALRDLAPTVVVGVDEQGICLGPHTVPFGGLINDFPDQPVIHDWIARAAMPATYFRDVCTRVIPARSADFAEIALHGALIDFEFFSARPLCTVVATDKNRIHILRLPQMQIEVRPTHIRALPPTCTVSAGFFDYMKEIINHEWAAIEFCQDQVIARGDDFVTIAKAATEARTSLQSLVAWRKVNIDWHGCWVASNVKLVEAIQAVAAQGGDDCRLRVDSLRDAIVVASTEPGQKFAVQVPVRGMDGAPVGDVRIAFKYLLDALAACRSSLVRLSFTHEVKSQASSPVVIRGEDEQFKAIISPRI